MLYVQDTVRQFYYGQKLVGAGVVQIMSIDPKFVKGIVLRAAGDNDPVPNTAPIWVGGPTVATNTGMPLAPGETLSLPLERGGDLYAISTTANQSIAWLGL